MEFEKGKYRFYYAQSTDSKGYIFRLSNNGKPAMPYMTKYMSRAMWNPVYA